MWRLPKAKKSEEAKEDVDPLDFLSKEYTVIENTHVDDESILTSILNGDMN